MSDAAYLRIVTAKLDHYTGRKRIQRVEVVVEGQVVGELPVATTGISYPMTAPAFVTVSTPLFEQVEEG